MRNAQLPTHFRAFGFLSYGVLVLETSHFIFGGCLEDFAFGGSLFQDLRFWTPLFTLEDVLRIWLGHFVEQT